MKTKIFTLLATSSLFMLGACSDNTGSATLADKCGEGVTEDCLVGTWNLKSISLKDGSGEPIFNFQGQAPGTGVLTFNDDLSFTYVLSSLTSDANCANVKNSGKWSLDEDTKTVSLKTTNGDCIAPSGSFTPVITMEGETIANMALQKTFFQQSESNGNYAGNDTEIFSRNQ